MKKRRILNTAFSLALAIAVAAAPSAGCGIELSKATEISSGGSVERIEKTEPTSTEKRTSEAPKSVEINPESLEKFENESDIFYEPKEESISTLEDSTAYINDSVTVFFSDGATDADKEKIVSNLGGEIVGRVDFMNELEIKIPRSDFYEINSLCDELMEDDCVDFASCSFAEEIQPDYVPEDPWNFTYWEDDALDRAFPFSNWWIKATDIDKAWDYDEYFSDLKIGIVDSGFDPEHEDLRGRIEFPDNYFKKNNAPSYHGNHVAGIIGATQDNGKGISGIVRDADMVCVDWDANKEQGQTWNSEARIMTGFVNAVRAGAKVVNFSLGSSGSLKKGFDRSKIVKDAEARFNSYYIAKMLQRGYDFICCQSAGNGVVRDNITYALDASNNGRFCPITVENATKAVIGVSPRDIADRIIIVAAAKFNGFNTYEQSPFSNGGSQVSICAPGSKIFSTYYSGDGNEYNDRSYAYLNGTSMAAPIVTGIATLVWSINPSFTGAQVKRFVCAPENTKYEVADSSSEYHLPTGTMRMVNAQLAVEAALREIEDYGTLTGHLEWARITPNSFIDFTLTSHDRGTVYRLLTDSDGNFTAKLPAGEYTLNLAGRKKKVVVTSCDSSDIGTLRSHTATVDFDAVGLKMKDGVRDILSKLQLY